MISLKAKILYITLVSLICLISTFTFYTILVTRAYQKLRLENIRRILKFETEKTNRMIAEIERGAIQLASNGFICQLAQSKEIGELSTLEFLHSFPAATGGGFWFAPYSFNSDTRRLGIHAYFELDENKVLLDNIEDEYDYHEMEWYQEIFDRIEMPYQVTWIKPYLDDTTFKTVITAGAGIFDKSGEKIGISILDWDIEEVLNALSDLKPTKNSIVMLSDLEKNKVLINTFCPLNTDNIFAETKSLENINKFLPYIIKNVNKYWSGSCEVCVSVAMINDEIYVAFERVMKNQWRLIVYSPLDEIFFESDNRNKIFTYLLSFIVVLILFLVYLTITKIIYLPIKKLTSSVNQISLNHLDVTTDSYSKDEIGNLAKAFNKMTAELQKSIDAYTKEHTEKEKICSELRIAAEIQSSMLPYTFPPYPERTEFDIHAIMHPAKEVGGDLYDFFFVDDNTLAIVIADVAGKSIPAALFMVITKILIKHNATPEKSLKEVLEAVNQTLCENNDTGMFVTCFIGYFNLVNYKFIYVNTGHNPPLLSIKKNDLYFDFLKTKPCTILGWKKNAIFTEEEIILNHGDILFLYTDGVTEAMNSEGEMFTEKRLQNILNHAVVNYFSLCEDENDKHHYCQPMKLLSLVKQEIDDFTTGTEQADDITMLIMKVK
ncbi:MAG: SpoIIE family protein phosphatase [Candidatus Cloacimonetes bacterium]|nr:SpoIIE family protein phosphatase [Candidatus Cloacimonadota bacterium]